MNTFLTQPEGLMILFTILALPIAIYIDNKTKQKRFTQYSQMGFSPIRKINFNRWARLERFSILEKMGFSHNASEYMIGTYRSQKMGLFLHIVADGSKMGKRQTATVIELQTKLPTFILRPESFRDKVKSHFGTTDINFNDDPLFSKKYFLQGSDEEAVQALFQDERVRNYFIANSGLWLECRGLKLLMFKEHDALTDGKHLRRIVEHTLRVKRLFDPTDIPVETQETLITQQPKHFQETSIQWNAKNVAIILIVLTVVIGFVSNVFIDSQNAYDERMAQYDAMNVETMASYLANINAKAEFIDPVTRHTGTKAEANKLYFYREVESPSFYNLVDTADIEDERMRMALKLKDEMCHDLPTYTLFYEKGGIVIYQYHHIHNGQKTFMFDIEIDKAFCMQI